MINTVQIQNFKCFKNLSVDTKPLTVLSGVNGMGKSSFVQSLLLLRQSVLEGGDYLNAKLNGSLVSLGFADDVLYENADSNEPITFVLSNAEQSQTFSFDYSKGSRVLSSIKYPYQHLSWSLFLEDFYYLKAERIGPRTVFDSVDVGSSRYNQIGNAGEYCAWLLASHERKPIGCESLLHKNQEINELRIQVEAWLSEIGQTPRIHLDEYHAMDRVSMQCSFMRDGIPSSNYRLTNVGFGLTYVLPIFVAALLAKPGALIIIENPEAHLHPKGQSAIGLFLSQVAASGIQVFVETHSDHLLNGIRIATKRGLIKPDDVSLHFFNREHGAQSTTVITPTLDKHGRLNHWPEGFFDEWENGLANLL